MRLRALLAALALGLPAAAAPPASAATTSLRNPVVPETASGGDTPDPWIFLHAGRYWLTYTSTDHIEVRSAPTLDALASARPRRLWPRPGRPDPAERSQELWAPEIHRLTGPDGPRWYVYYAARGTDDPAQHRLYVLESARDDPAGPYRFKAQLRLPEPYTIDGTVARIGGRTYLLYAGGQTFAPTSIELVELSNPWTVAGDPVVISQPQYAWERVGLPIDEGPEVLLHDGLLHVIFSASWCGSGAYALGRLTVPAAADLLDPATWAAAKVPAPVFAGAPGRGVFGPGHGSFFTSPDGRQSWMVYHATENRKGCFTGGLRTTRAQRFTWNADGTPRFGRPVSLQTDIAAPGGDGTIAVQAEDAHPAPRRGTSAVADRRLFGYAGLRLAPGTTTLRLSVPRTARYGVHLRVLAGPAAGRLATSVDGGRADTRDLRRPAERADDLRLGHPRLTVGRHVLRLRTTRPLVVDQVRLQPHRR